MNRRFVDYQSTTRTLEMHELGGVAHVSLVPFMTILLVVKSPHLTDHKRDTRDIPKVPRYYLAKPGRRLPANGTTSISSDTEDLSIPPHSSMTLTRTTGTALPASLQESITPLLHALGNEIEDPEEESFLLFSQSIPSQNLGFVDSKVTEVDVTIGRQDFTIKQSPGLLNSNRTEGTTGAVLWKVTPLVASWLASPDNVFRRYDVLNPSAWVLELGCGISGLIGLAIAPTVGNYVLTDQAYVMRTLRENVVSNEPQHLKGASKHEKKHNIATPLSNLHLLAYDWEDSSPVNVSSLVEATDSSRSGVDLVVACDCIYNDYLIVPFVRTCADICGLRRSLRASSRPTICVVAQQLRSEEVLRAWLEECVKFFHVWRCPDEVLVEGLREGYGFVVHICVLRSWG